MDKKTRQYLLLITFGVALYACLMNLTSVFGFLQTLGGIFLPVISGLILAFVLNVPLNGSDYYPLSFFYSGQYSSGHYSDLYHGCPGTGFLHQQRLLYDSAKGSAVDRPAV